MNYSIFLIFFFSFAPLLFARGGGGCLEGETKIATLEGYKKISEISLNDKVLTPSNKYASVSDIYKVHSEEFVEISACSKKIKATLTHPFKIEKGIFKEAGFLKEKENIFLFEQGRYKICGIEKIKKINNSASAYNLLAFPQGEFIAEGFQVHNKGCFLPDTKILKADKSETEISKLKEGDIIMAFEKDGKTVSAKIRKIIKLEAKDYYIINTPFSQVKATAEHPFYAGEGVYKTVESLKAGDAVFLYDGSSIRKTNILSVQKKTGKTEIYNLKTDAPNTFFANYLAVHNKGCFPAGVKIKTPSGEKNIEQLKPGDEVLSFFEGSLKPVKVVEIYERDNFVLTIKTDRGVLKTTEEHPLLSEKGFLAAKELKPEDKVFFYDSKKIITAKIENFEKSSSLSKVYNLSVESPNTFIADGFVVHNKGGGGFSSRSRSRSSRPRTAADNIIDFAIYGIVIIVSLFTRKKEGLDEILSSSEVSKKSSATKKLLEEISKTDANFEVEYLRQRASEVFLKLQECWTARNYSPMSSFMMEHLLRQHEAQLEIMKRDHEINKMDNLALLDIDVVSVRYTKNEQNRFFTALITAEVKDYYVDDRSGSFIRGDNEISKFQEFWSFRFLGGAWLLDKIEQTAESNILKKDNYVEALSETNIIAKPAAADPVAVVSAPVSGDLVSIAGFIHNMHTSDPVWDMGRMEIDASLAFINIYSAWSLGDVNKLPKDKISLEFFERLSNLINEKVKEGFIFEIKNFCIRKTEIVLVNTRKQGKEDEYLVRFSAHAQKKMTKGSSVFFSDEYVKPFVEYWLFSRYDNKWLLKEILPKSQDFFAAKDDYEHSPALLQWYFSNKDLGL